MEPVSKTEVQNNGENKTETTKESHSKHLDDRMKEYEKGYNVVVDPTKPYILRLDGHGFSKFVRPFNKPYDTRIHNAMIKTAAELLNTFGATSAFTCSDEITLIFPSVVPSEGCEHVPDVTPSAALTAALSKTRGKDKDKEIEKEKEESSSSTSSELKGVDPQSKIIYGGRVQKIVSYSAGLASVAFLAHIKAETYDPEKDAKLITFLSTARPYFDSRVFSVPSNIEVLNNVLWRHKFDYRRNSISQLARAHFNQKELHGLHGGEQLAKLKEKGIDWNDEPGWYKWGSFIKKQMKMGKATNSKTGQEVDVIRTKIVEKCFGIEGFSIEHVHFLLSRYIPEDDEQVLPITY